MSIGQNVKLTPKQQIKKSKKDIIELKRQLQQQKKEKIREAKANGTYKGFFKSRKQEQVDKQTRTQEKYELIENEMSAFCTRTTVVNEILDNICRNIKQKYVEDITINNCIKIIPLKGDVLQIEYKKMNKIVNIDSLKENLKKILPIMGIKDENNLSAEYYVNTGNGRSYLAFLTYPNPLNIKLDDITITSKIRSLEISVFDNKKSKELSFEMAEDKIAQCIVAYSYHDLLRLAGREEKIKQVPEYFNSSTDNKLRNKISERPEIREYDR